MRDEFEFGFERGEEIEEDDIMSLGSYCYPQIFEPFNGLDICPFGMLEWRGRRG